MLFPMTPSKIIWPLEVFRFPIVIKYHLFLTQPLGATISIIPISIPTLRFQLGRVTSVICFNIFVLKRSYNNSYLIGQTLYIASTRNSGQKCCEANVIIILENIKDPICIQISLSCIDQQQGCYDRIQTDIIRFIFVFMFFRIQIGHRYYCVVSNKI